MVTRHEPRKPAKVRSPEGDQLPPNVFAKGVSNIIAGELLVQLTSAAAEKMTTSILRGPSRGRVSTGARSFGIKTLDDALDELNVTELTSLHPPAPVRSAALAEAVQMAGTYLRLARISM